VPRVDRCAAGEQLPRGAVLGRPAADPIVRVADTSVGIVVSAVAHLVQIRVGG
jgi:hypothetical protein